MLNTCIHTYIDPDGKSWAEYYNNQNITLSRRGHQKISAGRKNINQFDRLLKISQLEENERNRERNNICASEKCLLTFLFFFTKIADKHVKCIFILFFLFTFCNSPLLGVLEHLCIP